MEPHKGKIIIISAPSGCGKSTIINAIINDPARRRDLQFSVSATNRPPREGEVDGVNYYFLSDDTFHRAIERDLFVEYEEVYPGRFYGTLKSEIERITSQGHNVVLDVDVKGGVNVRRMFGDSAVSIFIMPPSVETLRQRLTARATDPADAIEQRVSKAAFEISFAPQFDHTVVNDRLDDAVACVASIIDNFTD